MSIFLQATPHNPKGVDGRGHNRIALLPVGGDEPQCALRPKYLTKFYDSCRSTEHARFSGYAGCDGNGECSICPRLNAAHSVWDYPDTMIIREMSSHTGFACIQPEGSDPYENQCRWIKFEDLLAISGVSYSRTYTDEHGMYIKAMKVSL